MKVYCSHLSKTFTKASNYYHCNFCGNGWYGINPAPLVIVGFTDAYEASPSYMDSFVEKDLSKKNWTRCPYCKDLLEKRKHVLCNLKDYFRDARKQHAEFVVNIMIVLRGFKKDK
jgi:hypothetical protein